MDKYSEERERLELLGYKEDAAGGVFEQLLDQEFGEEISYDKNTTWTSIAPEAKAK